MGQLVQSPAGSGCPDSLLKRHIHPFLGVASMKSILLAKNSILDTFGRLPLTPQVLSAFTMVSNEMWKYFAIRVCTGY